MVNQHLQILVPTLLIWLSLPNIASHLPPIYIPKYLFLIQKHSISFHIYSEIISNTRTPRLKLSTFFTVAECLSSKAAENTFLWHYFHASPWQWSDSKPVNVHTWSQFWHRDKLSKTLRRLQKTVNISWSITCIDSPPSNGSTVGAAWRRQFISRIHSPWPCFHLTAHTGDTVQEPENHYLQAQPYPQLYHSTKLEWTLQYWGYTTHFSLHYHRLICLVKIVHLLHIYLLCCSILTCLQNCSEQAFYCSGPSP